MLRPKRVCVLQGGSVPKVDFPICKGGLQSAKTVVCPLFFQTKRTPIRYDRTVLRYVLRIDHGPATLPIGEALFNKTRREILALLFGQPDAPVFAELSGLVAKTFGIMAWRPLS